MKALKLLALSLAFWATSALGETNFIRAGVGVGPSLKSAVYSYGVDGLLDHEFVDCRLEGGVWTDSRPNRTTSPYLSPAFSLRVGRKIRLRATLGILIAAYLDDQIGSNFEFTEEIALGIGPIDVGYKHVSNAGLAEPNIGRDFIFVDLRF